MTHLFSKGRSRWLLAVSLAATAVLPPLPVSAPLMRSASADEHEPVPANVREAIDKSLAWLAKDQKPDGTFTQGTVAGGTCVPSLAVLAFLAAGHEPGKGQYGDIINRSIDLVLDSQQDDGLIAHSQVGNPVMYEHGISTAMLAEAYTKVDKVRRARIHKALAKSVEMLLDAQHPRGKPKSMPFTGGWRYQVNCPDADISVTAWQMLALHGAVACGIDVPKEQLEAARQYILRSAFPTGGFGYQPGQSPNQARTGAGTLMLELFRNLDDKLAAGEHPKEAIAGGDYLMQNPPDKYMSFYFYGVYECSEALDQLGGKYWDVVYLKKLRPTLLGLQEQDGHFDGSNGQETLAGPAYRTALACISLCVPYHNLSIYRQGK